MNNVIALTEKKNEARVDSRLMAKNLGITHGAVLKTIDSYLDAFKNINPLRFEIDVVKRKQGGGTPTRYALLSEDQSYLLLTFSRNTKRVVELKINLVQAFGRFRRDQKTAVDYLPFYHDLHDAIKALTSYAQVNGSTTEARIYHLNYNNLINKACGIAGSQRQHLAVNTRVNVTNATAAVIAAIKRGIDSEVHYLEIYQMAKAATRAAVYIGNDNALTQVYLKAGPSL
ncbi:Rha family transcriptional regulator [Methylobacter sp. S3L5C]|uniref:Rha family transcriptional regulator n=1 Tax=Methylobacter sp. S3L5C TaxID=2839024 RepID=UPI001FAD1A2D|nr:Rha family transcriptional regulator [Methylobacter sp. S3L5C]UOA08575.1 Rha family transcriptional regulator [Methylobacter sp. S3L5C]